jgi:hypothetical protein
MVRASRTRPIRTTARCRVIAGHISRLPGRTADVIRSSRTRPIRTTARIRMVAGHVAHLAGRAAHMVCARWTRSARTAGAVRMVAPHVARLSGWTTDVVGAVRTRAGRTADRVGSVVALECDREGRRSLRTALRTVGAVVRHLGVRRVVNPRRRAIDLHRRRLGVAGRAEDVPDRGDPRGEARPAERPCLASNCYRRRRAEREDDRDQCRRRPTAALREQPRHPRRARSVHASFHSLQQMAVGHVAIRNEGVAQILEIRW